MAEADLDRVLAIADIVHPGYPEDLAVFAERLRLYPAGCRVLETGQEIAAYVLSHPWIFGQPPKLNHLLGQLPAQPNTYYLHDIALLPAARGAGAASTLVGTLVEHAAAAGFTNVSLVAVNNSAGFWLRHGFHRVDDPAIDQNVRSYDLAACYMVRHLPNNPSE